MSFALSFGIGSSWVTLQWNSSYTFQTYKEIYVGILIKSNATAQFMLLFFCLFIQR